jgi:hypothetical protein
LAEDLNDTYLIWETKRKAKQLGLVGVEYDKFLLEQEDKVGDG